MPAGPLLRAVSQSGKSGEMSSGAQQHDPGAFSPVLRIRGLGTYSLPLSSRKADVTLTAKADDPMCYQNPTLRTPCDNLWGCCQARPLSALSPKVSVLTISALYCNQMTQTARYRV